MRLQAPPEVPEEPGQFWKDFIRDTAPHFRKSTTEQLTALIEPLMIAVIGVIIGGMIVALYMPVFTIFGQIK